LYWPSKKKLGIWKNGLYRHEMWLFPTKKAAEEACKDWNPPPDGPIPRRVTINVYGEKR
jgi:hypothetical protein